MQLELFVDKALRTTKKKMLYLLKEIGYETPHHWSDYEIVLQSRWLPSLVHKSNWDGDLPEDLGEESKDLFRRLELLEEDSSVFWGEREFAPFRPPLGRFTKKGKFIPNFSLMATQVINEMEDCEFTTHIVAERVAQLYGLGISEEIARNVIYHFPYKRLVKVESDLTKYYKLNKKDGSHSEVKEDAENMRMKFMNVRDKDRQKPLPSYKSKPNTVNRAEIVRQSIQALPEGINASYKDISNKAWELFRWKLSHKDIESVKYALRKKGEEMHRTFVNGANGTRVSEQPKQETPAMPSVSLMPKTETKDPASTATGKQHKSRGIINKLKSKELFALCKQLEKNKAEIAAAGYTLKEAAAFLSRECGFPVNQHHVSTAKEATGIEWKKRTATTVGGGKSIQRDLILARRIADLYEKLALERPDDIHQIIDELTNFGKNAK